MYTGYTLLYSMGIKPGILLRQRFQSADLKLQSIELTAISTACRSAVATKRIHDLWNIQIPRYSGIPHVLTSLPYRARACIS